MPDTSINEELDEILAAFVTAEENGEPVRRDELLEQHPELADELRAFFADRDQFKRLASPIRPETARRNDLPAMVQYFGDYQLLEEIAQGGMGVVYKARQSSLNRIVAIKMILAGHLATDADVQRFTDEARTAASLTHQAIVPIHEVGQQNGQHYFSMDLIEGRNLADVIRTDPPEANEAARIINAIAEAVDYAHRQGIIHRDIKPSNILIDDSGQVHITDFGLALRVEGESELTRTGQVLGTPAYMPPEQARGLRDLVGPASDIYALGAVLYELLTGRPPFRGATVADTLGQLIDNELVAPRQLEQGTPQDLETICLKCLEKEPYQRYGTAALLADDLGRFLRGEPIEARRPGFFERAKKWTRRKPASAGLIAVSTSAILLLVAGLIVSNVLIRGALDERTTALAQVQAEKDKTLDVLAELTRQQEKTRAALTGERKALEERTSALEQRNEAFAGMETALSRTQQLNYYHLIDLAWREATAGNEQLVDDFLRDCPPELRNWEWYFVQRNASLPSETPPFRVISSTTTPTMFPHVTATFSSDGRYIASAVKDRASTRRTDGNVYWLAPVFVWNAASGDEISRIDFPRDVRHPPFDVVFSPDNKLLALAVDQSGVAIAEIATGTVLHHVDLGSTYRVSFDALGNRIVAAHAGGATVLDVETGAILAHIEAGAKCTGAVFTKEGEFLITCNESGEVACWDLATKLKTRVFIEARQEQGVVESEDGNKHPSHLYCNAITFDPDYTRIAAAFASGRAIIWDFESGEEVLKLKGHKHWIYNISFSTDGQRIVTAGRDGTIKIWDATSFREILTLENHQGRVFCAVFDPQMRRLVSTADDGKIRIWNSR